jgi:CHAD domain-containing protein
MIEVELKLGAPPRFRLPDLIGLTEGVRPEPAEPAQLRTTYWDTPDLRLARWGCSLRHRGGEGWTVKLPGEVAEGVLSRPEVTFEGSARSPAEDALDLVRSFIRNDSVEPVARLRTRRNRIDLVGNRNRLVATVTLDDVAVMDGRRVAHRFREIEVELKGKPPDGLLGAVRDRLSAAGAGDPDPTPKPVRALGERVPAEPEVHSAPPGPDASIAEVFGAAMAGSVRRLLLHDPAVRLDQDPEATHQCRVAARRLRSDLRTFRPHLDLDRTEPLRDELRWVGGELGAVRDADVLLERLGSITEALPERDLPAAESLLGRLERERKQAQESLLATLRGDRYVSLLDRLVALAQDPPLLDGEGAAVDVLPALLDQPWGRLRKAVRSLGDPASDEELHRVRIRVKRCRYAAEAVAGVLGKATTRFAKAAAGLQDILGDHQDTVVAEDWLRGAVPRSGGPQSFAAGLLASRLWDQRANARKAFPRAWKRVEKRGPDTWV